MEAELDRGVAEPGLDHPGPPVRVRVESLAPFQRLAANPFLVFLAWLAAFVLIRHGIRSVRLGWFLAGLTIGLLAPLLLQCHCLDCGATIWPPRRQRHACRAVSARAAAGRARRFPFPSLTLQFVIWTLALALAAGALMLHRLGG